MGGGECISIRPGGDRSFQLPMSITAWGEKGFAVALHRSGWPPPASMPRTCNHILQVCLADRIKGRGAKRGREGPIACGEEVQVSCICRDRVSRQACGLL